ncbi:MAG TPA: hypothetical protein VNV66_05055 [Pilimelia sp.]|nr:hypothetical protein [Pilimelia sp.]
MSDGTTVKALLRLAEVMDATADDLHTLAARARDLAAEVQAGHAWSEVVTEERRPLIVERLTDALAALAAHGATFRRAEARALHAEGLSHERIAALFGVTRQRVGALLSAKPAGTPRRRSRAEPTRRP